MNPRRERGGESGMDLASRGENGRATTNTNIVWEVRITFGLLNRNTYHVVPDILLSDLEM